MGGLWGFSVLYNTIFFIWENSKIVLDESLYEFFKLSLRCCNIIQI